MRQIIELKTGIHRKCCAQAQEDKETRIVMGRRDAALLAILLAAGVLLFFIFRQSRPEGGTAAVRVGGELYGSYDLHTDQEIEITGKNGGTNLLQIHGGKASVTQASCPDHLCVRQGAVSRQGESIICLPHEVVVEITAAKEEADYDVLAR